MLQPALTICHFFWQDMADVSAEHYQLLWGLLGIPKLANFTKPFQVLDSTALKLNIAQDSKQPWWLAHIRKNFWISKSIRSVLVVKSSRSIAPHDPLLFLSPALKAVAFSSVPLCNGHIQTSKACVVKAKQTIHEIQRISCLDQDKRKANGVPTGLLLACRVAEMMVTKPTVEEAIQFVKELEDKISEKLVIS